MSELVVDARRLLCPLPVIRLQQAVKTAGKGVLIQVIATDPGVKNDIPAWCRVHQVELKSIEEKDREFIIVVQT